MNLSEIAWQDLDLQIEESARADAPQKLKGVLSFGQPVSHDCIALAKASGEKPDAEMQLLSKDHRFTYVRFALSIRPGSDYVVSLISLDVTLDGGAVCWSMEPLRVEQQVKAKAEASVSSKLKLRLLELGSQTKESEEYIVYQPVVEAFNLQAADPAWELRAASGKQLSGVQVFHMVVKAPKAAQCMARVALRADISKKNFFFSYRALSADQREEVAAINL